MRNEIDNRQKRQLKKGKAGNMAVSEKKYDQLEIELEQKVQLCDARKATLLKVVIGSGMARTMGG